MKFCLFLSLIILFFIPLVTNHSIEVESIIDFEYSDPCPLQNPILHECNQKNPTQSLNHLGLSLVLNSYDSADLRLCPGDAFGDLNGTYAKVEECNLTLYHRGNIIWSHGKDTLKDCRGCNSEECDCVCVVSLRRDGSMVFLQEMIGWTQKTRSHWDSKTKLNPLKTIVKPHDQQLQIVQMFKDGSQRLFYLDGNHKRFKENLGEPVKVAEKLIIKDHTDEDNLILRRNEYIGDLNGTHIILEEDCKLQLLTGSRILWSLNPNFQQDNRSCFLGLLGPIKRKAVWICQRTAFQKKNEYCQDGEMIMRIEVDLDTVQSKISFDDDQPTVIQTLQNGSEITYSSGKGCNLKLREKRDTRQIAEKTLSIPAGQQESMQRMDYIGNLAGLHLILEHNCSLMLVNADQKLWEFKMPPNHDIVTDCEILSYSYGRLVLKDVYSIFPQIEVNLLKFYYGSRITGYQLTLENNHVVIACNDTQQAPDFFYAGQYTHGAFFQKISERSLVINRNEYFLSIPRMGYIGDLNGVFAVLQDNCNWVLYNKTQVLWQSGRYWRDEWNNCELILHQNGVVDLFDGELYFGFRKGLSGSLLKRNLVWSSQNSVSVDKGVLKTELMVNEDGLWLIYMFYNGTVLEYKAKEGTNRFEFIK